MTKSPKYRVVATVVAAVFLVFNVGLPIVIASCPMTQAKTAACGMCSNELNTGTQKITSVKNSSCCTTVIAADKNSTEFVGAKYIAYAPAKFIVSTIVPVLFNNLSFTSVLREDHPFFLPIDIPIFTSSLLI